MYGILFLADLQKNLLSSVYRKVNNCFLNLEPSILQYDLVQQFTLFLGNKTFRGHLRGLWAIDFRKDCSL